MKRRWIPFATVVLLIFLAAAGAVGWKLVQRYIPSKELADKSKIFSIKSGQVAVLLNNELKEVHGIYEDGQVYLPVTWVNDYLNKKFYWDESERMLSYVLPETIVYADESTMGEVGPLIKVKESGVYLSLGLVVNYTDVRAASYATSEIKRVFIDNTWGEESKADVVKDGYLRTKGGIKSPVITKVEAGETVRLLEAMDKWSEIRTDTGYVGYIENGCLSNYRTEKPVSMFEAPVYTNQTMDEKVCLVWHQMEQTDGNQRLEQLMANTKGVNVISPTWYKVSDNDGNFVSLASKEYVDKAHDMGLQVWALVDNFSKDVNSKVLLSSAKARRNLIEGLVGEAQTFGFDGINLDFENLKADMGPHYLQFIRELSVRCRILGLVLSVDNPVPAPYNLYYDREEQADVVDYVIVMGYDEHYSGSEAGSVASINFVKEGIVNTLKEVPKEKVINAIPFYTRLWTVSGSETKQKAMGIASAEKWMEEHDVPRYWIEELGQYYGELLGDEGNQYIWMEEERSLGLKIDAIKEHDLAGVACWKLGFEPAEIWDVVKVN